MENNLNDKIQYWIEISDYDLETADSMLTGKRYLSILIKTRDLHAWIKKKLLKS